MLQENHNSSLTGLNNPLFSKWLVFAGLMALFILCYLPLLTTFPLSIDAEFAAIRTDPVIWIEQGRWGNYLVELILLPIPLITFLPYMLFGLCMVTGYLMLIKALRLKAENWQVYAIFPLFICYPTWLFMAEFPANLPAVGIGFVLANYCLLNLSRAYDSSWLNTTTKFQKMGLIFIASSTLAIALGCYQSILFYYLTATALMLLLAEDRENLKNPRRIRIIATIGITALIGVVAYYVIWKLSMWLTSTQPSYVQDFMKIQLLAEKPGEVVSLLFRDLLRLYTGSARIYGVTAWGLGALLLNALIIITLRFRHYSAEKRIWATALFIGFLIAPFGLNLVSGGHMPFRALIAIPLVIWLWAYISVSWVGGLWRRISYGLIVIVILQLLYTMSIYQSSKFLVAQHDQALASQIYTRIVESNEHYDANVIQKVDFYGGIKFHNIYPIVKDSAAGVSFFSWDNGNVYRIVNYMNILGYKELQNVSNEDRLKLIPEYESMEVWPAKGSVKRVSDTLLIKLNSKPGMYIGG